ncbi:MAG: N-acetylmuramoyl-L-alanine amidase [Lachnospiraceae bacterium]|nr:N-acetylmuramoyl-L-alanine amidase [Lachnospiraceae bacterium]
MRILLTVGHSILKSGAITSADGTKMGGGNEYKYCKSLSKYVKKYLEANGHDVNRLVCPEGTFAKATDERTYKLAIEHATDYDLVIELHLNAAITKTAQGCEVLYKSTNGKKYASKIQKQLAKVFKDRGIVKRDNLYILNQTKAPAVLVEVFFCTNPKEWKYAINNKEKIAKLIANGIG